MTRRRETLSQFNHIIKQSRRKVRIENGRIFDVIAWKFLWIAINYCGFHVEHNSNITVCVTFFFLIFKVKFFNFFFSMLGFNSIQFMQ